MYIKYVHRGKTTLHSTHMCIKSIGYYILCVSLVVVVVVIVVLCISFTTDKSAHTSTACRVQEWIWCSVCESCNITKKSDVYIRVFSIFFFFFRQTRCFSHSSGGAEIFWNIIRKFEAIYTRINVHCYTAAAVCMVAKWKLCKIERV